MSIQAQAYMHPEDKAALQALEKVPLFPQACKALLKALPERQLHGINMASKVLLGPDQLPEIWGLLPPLCRDLGIEIPDLYLEMDPTPNAYTFGATKVFITITSGVLDAMETDELRAVLAHECGHIACNHVLYHTLADVLVQGGEILSRTIRMVSGPLQIALFYWKRRSEFSADRAAALALRGSSKMIETLVRLSGGPKAITSKINIDAYVAQAAAYDGLSDSTWDRVLQGIVVMNNDHPFSAIRARELIRWGETDEFKALTCQLSEIICEICGQPMEAEWCFCKSCGRSITNGT